MSETAQEYAVVRPSKSISIVWLLPLIALAIGAWLLYRSLADAPIEITIDFPTGTGIEIGKTKVIFEGITAGVVKDVRLDQSDMQGVIATVEMDNRVEPALREDTAFWLVKPEISLSGITGLETIVSGNYIAVKPSFTGKPSFYFKALEAPPAVDMTESGLHLKLLARDLGSIYQGAPLLYKKIMVGEVLTYDLDTGQDLVVIRVLIRPPYDKLISKKTRFWNSSGVRFKAGLEGVDVRMDSLLSVVKGGITFDNTDLKTVPAAENGDEFKLFTDFSSAKRGVSATILFDANQKVAVKGTRIMFKGFEAGEVRSLKLSDDHTKVIARVSLSPELEEHLNSGTRFWIVKPQISLSGISGLDTLLGGNYIEMNIGKGEPSHEFVALNAPPPIDTSLPGLRLRLEAPDLGSLAPGSPVLYRKIPVGTVQHFKLSSRRESVLIDVLIKPEYSALVNSHSRFWNASGVEFSGSLSKVKLRTESLASILQGGVAFFNPPGQKGDPVKANAVFNLYADFASAQEKGTLVDIELPSADGVSTGTAIRYQGIEVGSVKSVSLKPDLDGVTVQALLHLQPEKFAREGSLFWLVQPKLSITGAANLETLVTGKYFEVVPGNGRPQHLFSGLLSAPVRTAPTEGLNLTLTAARLGSVKEGLTVYYREVPVGRVTGFRLGDSADQVEIYINIEPRYAALVRKQTRFWNASGISVDVGLFKGAKIKTESLESILAGGISFATPDDGNDLPLATAADRFVLHREFNEAWLAWKPKISLQP